MRLGKTRSGLLTAFVGMVLMVMAVPAWSTPTIVVGDWILQAGLPNQTINIDVTGLPADLVAGLNFYAQIGDGGTYVGGTDTKPKFQNVDILTGTIFGGNNTGATGDPNGTPPGSNAGHPLIWVDGTTTNTGTVVANGKFVTLTIDMTGVLSGEFPLLLTGVAPELGGFNTELVNAVGAPVTASITNGRILVPEPATMGLFTLAGLAALARRRSHR